jgi:hypothetical protein
MFARLKRDKAEEGFGNLIAVANKSAEIRDLMLEDMDAEVAPPMEAPVDLSPAESNPEDNDQTEEDTDDELGMIPETNIEDASAEADKVMNMNVPDNADDYVGGDQGAANAEIESVIPSIISAWENK